MTSSAILELIDMYFDGSKAIKYVLTEKVVENVTMKQIIVKIEIS